VSAPVGVAARRAQVGTALVFFVHGVVIATWVPRIPAIKERLGLTEGSLGVALLGLAVGALLAMQVVGPLLGRFGSRPVTRVAVLANAALLVAPALAWNLPSLLLALWLFGISIGLVDTAMNAHGVVVERSRGRPIMAGLHGLWSVGGLVGSVAAGFAAGAGWDLLPHFALTGAVLGVLAVVGTRGLLPATADRLGAPQRRDGGGGAVAGWGRAVLLLGLVGFCSFVGEGTAADWSALYLRQLGASAGAAAAGYAAFSLAMATCRLLGDRLTARTGPVRMVRAGGLVAAVGLGLGVASAQQLPAALGFGLLGVGLAAVVPIAFSAAGNLGGHGGHGGVGIARVASLAYLGTLAGPPAIGFTAELLGLRLALLIPLVLSVVIVLCAGGVATAAGPRGHRSDG
jgi:MFS family permease